MDISLCEIDRHAIGLDQAIRIPVHNIPFGHLKIPTGFVES
jgi:hypothetical protein